MERLETLGPHASIPNVHRTDLLSRPNDDARPSVFEAWRSTANLMSSLASQPARDASPTARFMSHVALGVMGLLIFQALTLTSGRIDEGDGLGWDGRNYASLMTGGLDQGSAVARSRPLLPVVTRIPHALGLDVVLSFQLMNAIYAFTLYLFTALIIDLYDRRMRVKAIVIGNLALCIATSKMFAFYPVQIDLGALALIAAAFYFVLTDRHGLAGGLCMLAVASREFGVAVLVCGVLRTFRRGRLWPEGLWYLPSVAMATVVRMTTYSVESLSANEAVANLELWRSPIFVAAFSYFAVTVFGGVSALLVVHPRHCVSRLRQNPELVTFLIVIVVLAAVGSLDIWRYQAFALPVVVVLIAQYYRDYVQSSTSERSIAAAMTFATMITQRPFEQMDRALYFRDWFPLYNVIGQPPSPDLLALWATRFGALTLLVIVLASIGQSTSRMRESAS